jgi:hypothetical protein
MRVGLAGAVVTALPVVALVAAMVGVAVGEWRGRSPLGLPPFRNSAEAAAAGDAPTALRYLRMGDNPTRMYPLRSDVISSRIVSATTLEAALWSRHIEMIRVLDREGAIVDADERRQLACLAQDLDLPDIANYLAPDQTCVRGAALERIIARSKPEVAGRHD